MSKLFEGIVDLIHIEMTTKSPRLSTLFVVLILSNPCFAVDNTLVKGSTGTAVVESCVSKIYASGIFKEDFNLIRYSAYADTKDGAELASQNIGGIWAVNSDAFTAISDSTYDVSSYYSGIQTSFNIDWTQVTYADLDIPLYSAIAQRLHIAYWEIGDTLQDDIDNLGIWWAIYLHTADENMLISDFTTAISPILTGCSKPQRDVVFLIDSSLISGETYFTSAKTITTNVIKQLKVDSNPNTTVVGVAQYSSLVEVAAYLNGSASEADIVSIVSTLQLISGSRMTGSSVSSVLPSVFSNTNGAKGWDTGTPQVLCLLTAGDSIDSMESVASAASSAAVNVIAVGMTGAATLAELNLTATAQVTDHVFQRSTFTTATDMEYAITRRICADTALVPSDATVISGTIDPGQTRSIRLLVNSTGIDTNVATTQGTMDLYYSAIITEPTSANYDYTLSVPSPNQEVQFKYVPTLEEVDHHGGGDTVYLYITLQGDASVSTEFTFTIQIQEVVTVVVSVNNSTALPTDSSSSGLSEGEIAGIVFSCLIVFCAVLVATVYYRFGGYGNRMKKSLIHRGRIDRLMDSSSPDTGPSTVKQIERIETGFNQPVPLMQAQMPKVTEESTPVEEINLRPGDEDTSEEKENNEEEQQKRLEVSVRDRLQSAIKRRDMNDISDAVEDFMALRMEDYTGDFVTAQRMLVIQQCKEGITRAIASRNIKLLEKAIFRGKRMEYDIELKMELVNAEILLQDLKRTDNLLRRLKRAMDAGDLAAAEAITAELRVLKGCDQAMVDRMLQIFQHRDDIEESMERRDIAAINESIARITEKGFEPDLASEMKQARKILKDLAAMEQARSNVMGLKQSSVAEIKSYSSPPPGLHEVMMSVYLLLGYHPTQLQSWTAIQALMGKTGREGLRRRIGDMEVSRIDIMHARMAKSLLANFDLNSIRELSEALAVFYTFAQSVITEAERLTSDGDHDTDSHLYEIPSWSTPILGR
uniref:uncharacterized protein LOC120325398 n=1 Tax=Styela clava TaxID=7725 RepID=UPI00193A0CDA|nr:uncharacterized protein LOC120325398 [Styela clava]